MASLRKTIVSTIFTMIFASVGSTESLQSKTSASRDSAAPTIPNMDKWVGTWVLNPQKSRYGDDADSRKGVSRLKQILKIRVADGILDLYSRMEMSDGTDVADESHLVDLTGRPHVTEFDGFKPASETFKQIDRNSFEVTLKAQPTELLDVPNGELTVKVRFTISADGNTIRETKEYNYKEFSAANKRSESGPNPAEGSVLVFEKQRSQ
jgi:hypothetical protein